MEKEYQIEVEETLQRVINIRANSVEDAIKIAEKRYKNEEIVLDYNDLKDTKFKNCNDEIEKNKSKKESRCYVWEIIFHHRF